MDHLTFEGRVVGGGGGIGKGSNLVQERMYFFWLDLAI